jgi:hypothetical protein
VLFEMKVIVAGGRNFVPRQRHTEWLIQMLTSIRTTEVVSGGCSGADFFGESVAGIIGIPFKRFNAEWNKYGKSAGPIRNEEMAQYADACILFPGGRGTANMEKTARQQGIKVIKYGE